jgi:hypothetical protein
VQLTTIEMPVAEARSRLVEYEKRLESERTQQDEQIARGYRALTRGLPIIKLSETIQAGGFFDHGLPRMAIARADSQDCWVQVNQYKILYLSEPPTWKAKNRGALVNRATVRVPVGQQWHSGIRRDGHTIMPLIPPEHRPKARRLHLFHILWEVEEWTLMPPRDPALVRWVGGDLWSVVAVWDLTELERAVLVR